MLQKIWNKTASNSRRIHGCNIITPKRSKNVVGALGTALTQQQGFLLRKNAEKVILSFDSDEAGIKAKLRSIEILQNMGCDLRVLQLEGAKRSRRIHNKIRKCKISKCHRQSNFSIRI